ncbi:MAG TPA: histidine kinase dimerization/phospho-acceptor domain-containing protein, partial [Coleofasciculaceae cyanobacterium]
MSETIFDQQLTLSLRRLEDLWKRAENLPKPSENLLKQLKEACVEYRQLLKESLEEFSTSLESLQILTQELRRKNEALVTNHTVIKTECKRYRDLFELAPTAYLITTKELAILEVNRMASQLLNASPQHLRHKPLTIFIDAEKHQDFYTQLQKLQPGELIKNWQLQLQPRHGACIPLCCTVMPVRNAQGQVIELRWSMQDCSNFQTVESSDRKENTTRAKQEQVANYQRPKSDTEISNPGRVEWQEPTIQAIQDSSNTKQSTTAVPDNLIQDRELSTIQFYFTSRAAYELRNPLNTIASCAKLLESYAQQWSDEKKLSYLQRIQLNVKRMERLLDDFLLMGKIETGQLQLKPALVDLTEFCQQLIQELKQDVGRDRQISLACKNQTSGVWDKKLLRQIILHLLSTIIKYSPKKSPIQLDVDGQDGYVKFRIQS